jgi:hypothetical protein
MGGHEMTAMELYELLNKAEIEYEVIEIFEGARFIRVEVEEEEERRMKLFRNTDGAFETFMQMIWNKKLPWYENLLIWAGGVLLFVSFYALIFLAMLLGE